MWWRLWKESRRVVGVVFVVVVVAWMGSRGDGMGEGGLFLEGLGKGGREMMIALRGELLMLLLLLLLLLLWGLIMVTIGRPCFRVFCWWNK